MDILFIVAIAGFMLFWFLSEQNRDRARNRARYHDHSHHWFHDSGNYDSSSSDSFTDFGCNDSSFDGGGCDTDF